MALSGLSCPCESDSGLFLCIMRVSVSPTCIQLIRTNSSILKPVSNLENTINRIIMILKDSSPNVLNGAVLWKFSQGSLTSEG